MPSATISRVALYVSNLEKIAGFYARHFGFMAVFSENQDKATLTHPEGGLRLVLLQASKGHRLGQSCVKLVFDVADVERFKAEQAKLGLKFGVTHRGPGYVFANARDPARNLLQISTGHLVETRPSPASPISRPSR